MTVLHANWYRSQAFQNLLVGRIMSNYRRYLVAEINAWIVSIGDLDMLLLRSGFLTIFLNKVSRGVEQVTLSCR